MVRGTVDRIVDGDMAVILIEDQEEKEQLVVDKENIPEGLRYDGCMIEFEISESQKINNIEHLKESEYERRQGLEDKFDRLSSKMSESDEE